MRRFPDWYLVSRVASALGRCHRNPGADATRLTKNVTLLAARSVARRSWDDFGRLWEFECLALNGRELILQKGDGLQ